MSTRQTKTAGPEDRIASTLFGRTRRRVLTELFARPDEPLYVREIARKTGVAPGAIQRELQELAKAGVLKRSERGHQVFYQPDRECPVFMELESIVKKTSGLLQALRRALEPIRGRIELAFVFGSIAKGEARSSSDVDLFVVGDASFARVVHAVSDVDLLGREINPVVQTPAQFRQHVKEDDHFVTSVLRGPQWFVIGGADDLERLGREQVAGAARDEQAGGRRSPRRRRAEPRRQQRARA